MIHKYYKFTVPDIARAAAVTEAKVRRDIRDGRLVATNLKSVSAYVIRLTLGDIVKESQ